MVAIKKLSMAMAGVAFTVLGIGKTAQAAQLGTEDFTTNEGVNDIFEDLKVKLAIGPAAVGPGSSAPPTYAPLFEGTSITPSDVGRTFTVTQATDPNFNDFAAFLTDGKPGQVGLAFGSGSLGMSEIFVSKSGTLFGGDPDLLGNTINSISLQINSLTLDTPGIDPNGDGIWTDFSFNITAIVDGQPVSELPSTPVPEPASTVGTLVFSALGAGWMVKRQQKK